ncbi:MAG TPA: tRNA threonylcarbamoyladenosine dehydratase [Catalimonadaceae bacterium]|nr:tRNA threonylcarbamoyladenosine dehydratase [Catalimonadaceae bacterium]HPI09991.1 tRNA threonylcarbamoyladenosine dehydratase [Catalimonadaceae bacterium]
MQTTIPGWMSRTELLLGAESISNLINSNVLVVGLGGVGGICAEMIVRAGVGKMTIVDADTVEASNRNRQIPALVSTENALKSDVLSARLLDINPELKLTAIARYVREEITNEILESDSFDYVVDCIDTLSPKVFLIKKTIEKGIPIVSSMGAGGKVDPTQVQIGNLWKSYNCNLAYYVRKRLSQMGMRNRNLTVVWSPEKADQSRIIPAPEGNVKKSLIGTISYMPAVFGCAVASVVIRDLMGKGR